LALIAQVNKRINPFKTKQKVHPKKKDKNHETPITLPRSPAPTAHIPRRRHPTFHRTRFGAHLLDLLRIMVLEHGFPQTGRPEVLLILLAPIVLFHWRGYHLHLGEDGLVVGF